jgi:hypothetical protein
MAEVSDQWFFGERQSALTVVDRRETQTHSQTANQPALSTLRASASAVCVGQVRM